MSRLKYPGWSNEGYERSVGGRGAMRRLSWFISAAVFLLFFTVGITGAPGPAAATQVWTKSWTPISTSSGPSSPREIASDQQGDLYVISGSTVYERSISGAWTPLTASGLASSPDAVAVDNNGNVFVADFNCKVEELPNGASSWTTIATGDSTSGFLWGASGIAVDSSDNVYVVYPGNANASYQGGATDNFEMYYMACSEGHYSGGSWTWTHIGSQYYGYLGEYMIPLL